MMGSITSIHPTKRVGFDPIPPAWTLKEILISGAILSLIGLLGYSTVWTVSLAIWSGLLGAAAWTDIRTRHVSHSVILGMALLGLWQHWHAATPWPWMILPVAIASSGWVLHAATASVLGAADLRWMAALACAVSPSILGWAVAATCVLSIGWILAQRCFRPQSHAGVPLVGLLAVVIAIGWVVAHR